MDKPAGNVKRKKAQQPQDNQNSGNNPKHLRLPLKAIHHLPMSTRRA
jgi:hypothetical protein